MVTGTTDGGAAAQASVIYGKKSPDAELKPLYAELRGGAAFVPTYIRQKIDRRWNLCFSI